MVSRLDRLFILLDTGSNESIRLAAAKQLGQVQRVQPNDLDYLLQRIKEYSHKSVWETRVAAGQATRCVLEQLPDSWPTTTTTTTTINNSIDNDNKFKCKQEIADKIVKEVNFDELFNQFDLNKITSLCPKLLSLDTNIDNDSVETSQSKASSSASSSTSTTSSGVNSKRSGRKAPTKVSKEQLLRQRKLINKELGISMVDSLNLRVKSTDIVTNDDLQTDYDNKTNTDSSDSSNTSVSQNRQQQDAKAIIQSISSNYDSIVQRLLDENCIYKEQIIPQNIPSTNQNEQNKESERINHIKQNFVWPLRDIARSYSADLFNSSWEIRHGSAIALREIVKCHAKSAGRLGELSKTSNDILNQLWLVDMAFKALCVLALDRFGDFLFDQLVAPVRENAAQLLGCCVANMTKENAHSTIKLMLIMLQNDSWETRHGGIIALKYSLSVINETLSEEFLKDCFDPIYKCLGDSVDDVSAEAAACLVPVKDLVIKIIPDKAPKLIKFLWEHLADLDELTTSTSNIVLLLASLITSSSAQLNPKELIRYIPRLWPLMGHSSTTVRISVLKSLLTLLKSLNITCLTWMPDELLTTALRLTFQRSILENMDEVRPHIEEVWFLIIQVDEDSPDSQNQRLNLLKSVSQYLNYWLCLALQPVNVPIDRGSLMWLNIQSDGTKSDIKPDGDVYLASITFNAETQGLQKHQETKCRLLATKLLGALYSTLVNDLKENPESQHSKDALKYLADMFVHYIKTKSANQRLISGWALESWAHRQGVLLNREYEKLGKFLPGNLVDQIHLAIQEINLCYDELASTFTRLQQETRDFVSSLRNADISLDFQGLNDRRAIYNLNQIQTLCDLNMEVELNRVASKRLSTEQKHKKPVLSDTTKGQLYTTLTLKKNNLEKSLKSTQLSQKTLSTSVLSSLACTHIAWRIIPEKLNLIVNPLIDSIELEEEQCLQNKSIQYLVILFNHLCDNPAKSNEELMNNILKRLIDVLSSQALSMIFESNDPNAIPEVPNSARCSIDMGTDMLPKNYPDPTKIILLDNLQRKAELGKALSRRQSSINTVPSLKRSLSVTTSQDLMMPNTASDSNNSSKSQYSLSDTAFETKLRGSSAALCRLTQHFGDKLPDKLPQFWKNITEDIRRQTETHNKPASEDHSSNEIKLIKSLRLLSVVGESIHVDLRSSLILLFNDLIQLLNSSNPIIRHHSAQCIGLISKLIFNETIGSIQKKILPMLNQMGTILPRCGAIEAIALIIEHLQLDLVPRIDMFIIHVLRRMSDQNDQVRLMATHCFGKLLSLMPLNLERSNTANPDIKNLDDFKDVRNSVVKLNGSYDDQRFIEQLLNPKKLDNFEVPFKMEAGLRSYQQDGLNWLAFLNRFNLHGILCDEMGLGKTFMTICMVGADHYNELQKDNSQPRPSLIVCPSTLTEHWLYEMDKFLPGEMRKILCPVVYSGTMNDRMSLRCRIATSDQNKISEKAEESTGKGSKSNRDVYIVIASYDIIRNDIDFFRSVNWNYCVLDEGHIIKNGKTKLTKAIRLLNATHRLILSGTPIQNNVTELWSLFDFLMPGFLGSERQFNVRYTKPILQSREMKCSSRELEAGALAMESLHRQVLPFILRRLKEEVLDDLPPKIIQDYYCELSSLQHKLYEDFTRSKLCNEVTKKSIQDLNDNHQSEPSSIDENSTKQINSSKSHVFQALQYLKNVCNHPKLVLTQKHSKYNEFKKLIEAEKTSLDDINHSSKLKALKQLLIDCGIGVNGSGQVIGSGDADFQQPGQQQQQQANQQQTSTNLVVESVVNQHRALIFCQIRSMVNIIENDLLKKHLPSVTYLKLDGSIPANQRQSIVSRFNNDPSIDILLLTTQIGGLGLNLTGADTVIFVEHDWNPTKDLQAMDRAHRIGQKKVVNVYRLITKGTLEEKIMGLQKFKTMVSNTVINQDNAGLGTMNVDRLFDLFEDSAVSSDNNNLSSSNSNTRKRTSTMTTGGGGAGNKSFIELLPELWDQEQYETEYDLSSFVSSLKN